MVKTEQSPIITPPKIIVPNPRCMLETEEYKGFFKTVDAPKCMYPTRLDTYGCGCLYQCGYCYSGVILTRYKNWDPDNPKVADIEKIARKISRLTPGTIVRLGGMTDCFQPLEVKKRVTLETINLLNQQRVGYLIVTKSPLVSYPYFLDVLDPALAHIQVTVTCLDDRFARRYEPLAPPPEQRIDAILRLQRHGLDVAIRLSPLIEEYMDFDRLNGLGIENCVVEFLRVNNQMKVRLPRINFSKYTLFSGNYYHLPLEEKLRIIQKVKIPNITVCEKASEHYDFWQRNFNPNPKDCCNLRINPQPSIIIPSKPKLLTAEQVAERRRQAIERMRNRRGAANQCTAECTTCTKNCI